MIKPWMTPLLSITGLNYLIMSTLGSLMSLLIALMLFLISSTNITHLKREEFTLNIFKPRGSNKLPRLVSLDFKPKDLRPNPPQLGEFDTYQDPLNLASMNGDGFVCQKVTWHQILAHRPIMVIHSLNGSKLMFYSSLERCSSLYVNISSRWLYFNSLMWRKPTIHTL